MADKIVQINSDPFSRQALVRKLVPKSQRKECGFCNRLGRFVYGYDPGQLSSPVQWEKKAFCSLSCRDAYR